MPLPLVPLKIPEDWTVVWNHFTESEPENFINKGYIHKDEFQEDIFYFRNEEKRRILDLGWYPAHKPSGRYRLVLIEISDSEEHSENWDDPLMSYRTRDIHKLQRKINWVLKEVSMGRV
ncbi:hypothetical protein ACFSR7_16205 [Cohnella sp. GCM10020058]|uniref:hypothetical protein n=1 Tax=Cohnella sp. GCM10020058 TaxID=3317330 RepID=UPI0036319A01